MYLVRLCSSKSCTSKNPRGQGGRGLPLVYRLLPDWLLVHLYWIVLPFEMNLHYFTILLHYFTILLHYFTILLHYFTILLHYCQSTSTSIRYQYSYSDDNPVRERPGFVCLCLYICPKDYCNSTYTSTHNEHMTITATVPTVQYSYLLVPYVCARISRPSREYCTVRVKNSPRGGTIHPEWCRARSEAPFG